MRRKSARRESERADKERRRKPTSNRGLLFQVCLVCTHPGQQATAERGNGGYRFKVGDNRGTMASEGSKELMRGAVVVMVGQNTTQVRTKERRK